MIAHSDQPLISLQLHLIIQKLLILTSYAWSIIISIVALSCTIISHNYALLKNNFDHLGHGDRTSRGILYEDFGIMVFSSFGLAVGPYWDWILIVLLNWDRNFGIFVVFLELSLSIFWSGVRRIVLLGGTYHRDIHMNAKTQGFPAEHCPITRWSILFTSLVSGF